MLHNLPAHRATSPSSRGGGLLGRVDGSRTGGGAQPREMAPQMLFFGAARLALSSEQFERVLARMREIGAEIDLDANPASTE
ncbi:hypothetical protein [Cupriavidus necator]